MSLTKPPSQEGSSQAAPPDTQHEASKTVRRGPLGVLRAVFVQPPDSLWRSSNFLKFWTGQSISKLGDNFTRLALPLLILQLNASPVALGFYTLVYYLPYLILGLPAGVLADRFPRRRMMIICDAIRTLILGFIILCFVTGLLTGSTIWIVYCATLIFTTATIFFDVAYVAAMPNIVEKEQLLAGNGYLQTSALTGQLVGPTLAGLAVQFLGAAQALLFDAGSFVVSAISLLLIPIEFRAKQATATQAPATVSNIFHDMFQQIGEGLRFIWGHTVLRWTLLLIGANNFFTTCIFLTLFLFRLQHDLHYSAGAIGVIYAFSAVGGIAGSFSAGRLKKSFDLLPTALVATIVLSVALVACALTLPFVIYLVAMLVVGAGAALMNINALTLCQIVTPDEMLGRMQSVVRLLTWSPIALGTLLGAALAVPFGAAPVILVFCAISAALALGLFISPVRTMK